MELPPVNRNAILSLRLGLCAFLFGPFSGLPAILLGLQGLGQIRRKWDGSGGKHLARLGIVAGLLGSVLVPTFTYLLLTRMFWPDEQIRVDRLFKELEAERFYERQDGIWPTFRFLVPESVYRVAEKKWPSSEGRSLMLLNGYSRLPLPSGRSVSCSTLQEFAEPIIAMGRPAVPHLCKWVMHNDSHVRYVAILALQMITGELMDSGYFDEDQDGAKRASAIETWKKWYEKQP